MLPLNPQNLMTFSDADIDLILAALYDFTETDFSALWNKKRCRKNQRVAFQLISKFKSYDTKFYDGEIKLIYAALCFFEEYLLELKSNNQLDPNMENLLHDLPSMEERFASIMEFYGIVQTNNDG